MTKPTGNPRGRPLKPTAERRRNTQVVRLRDETIEHVRKAADDAQRSMSEELERLVEQSLLFERFLGSLAAEGPAAGLFRALQKAVNRVLRMSVYVPEKERGSPLEFELNTRRELHAAVEVVMHAYAATDIERPQEPGRDGKPIGKWGTGDRARLKVYYFLEWDNDPNLDRAKSTSIADYWTGTGQPVGDLVAAKLLTEDQGLRRRLSEGEPPSELPDRVRF